MTNEELELLVADCPHLYHMAMRNSWPLIQRYGLLPTNGLLELFEVDDQQRTELTTKRRPAAVPISHPIIGEAVIRDQIPMYDHHLERCLTNGLSPKDWHKRLNERVFFWLSEERLQRLLCASAYKKDEHIVLKLSTSRLIQDYSAQIELSPMNSGCTMPFPHPRGKATFLPIPKYPYTEWRAKRKKIDTVVELTVIGGIPNVTNYVEEVTVRKCGNILSQVYSSS